MSDIHANGIHLVRYDAMVSAIAECHRVDEVKDLRDRALALEIYAKQARNTEAERKAADVRLRAERRTGELLKELARSPIASGGDTYAHREAASNDETPVSEYAEALERTGISRQTASRYQELANVPAPIFEEALRDPMRKPSTSRLIQEARDPQPELANDALWLWGRARDFERQGFSHKSPAALMAGMTETMRCDMARIVPQMLAFFQSFAEWIDDESV